MLNLYTLSAKNLKLGCQTIFKSKAGPKYSCVNAKSAFKNGRCITDTVAVWLKKRLCYWAILNPPFQKIQHKPPYGSCPKNKSQTNFKSLCSSRFLVQWCSWQKPFEKIIYEFGKKIQSNISQDGQGCKFREIRLGGRVQTDPVPHIRMGILRFQMVRKFFCRHHHPF